jgi:hypothetical protein
MQDLVLDGEAFSVLIAPLLKKCRLSEENRFLLAQPKYNVRSRVSVDSFRTFVGAIGSTEPNITDDNSADLELLSDEFKFSALSTTVAAWRVAHPSQDADMKLIAALLDERLQLHDRHSACLIGRSIGCIGQ